MVRALHGGRAGQKSLGASLLVLHLTSCELIPSLHVFEHLCFLHISEQKTGPVSVQTLPLSHLGYRKGFLTNFHAARAASPSHILPSGSCQGNLSKMQI